MLVSQRTLDFDFFNLNEYLKEFSLAVKEFNAKGQLNATADARSKRYSVRLNASAIGGSGQARIDGSGVDHSVVKLPVGNIKSATMFQKMVAQSVSSDKKQARKSAMKKTIKSCLNKSFFYIRRGLQQKTSDCSEEVVDKVKRVKHKSVFIDVERVYNIPDMMKNKAKLEKSLDGMKTRFKVFRVKSVNTSMGIDGDRSLSKSRVKKSSIKQSY